MEEGLIVELEMSLAGRESYRVKLLIDNEKLARVADMMNEFLRKENLVLKKRNANLLPYKIKHQRMRESLEVLQGVLHENEVENEQLREELARARATIERLTLANRNLEVQLIEYDSDMTVYDFN